MPPGATRFVRRVLVVTSDKKYFDRVAASFREQQYEVLGAQDGFEALLVLRGALPDLMICELSLPRMSGFELLSVVRARFPQIAIIATSDEYNSASLPGGTIADAFVSKGPNAKFELLMTARDLIADSPLRASKLKPDLAPVWIPRSSTEYVILTCPDCLRSFSIAQPGRGAAGSLQETCIACGTRIRYQMAFPDEQPTNLTEARAQGMLDAARAATVSAEQAVSRTKTILNRRIPKRQSGSQG